MRLENRILLTICIVPYLVQSVPLKSDVQQSRGYLTLNDGLIDRITDFFSYFGYVNDFEIVQNLERVSDALNYYLTKDVPYEAIFYALLNPFQINKLTCGLLTMYDGGQNPAVGLDVCLAGLVVAKVFLAAPLVRSSLEEGGIFNIIDTLAASFDRLDLAGPRLMEGGVFNIVDAIHNSINTDRIDLSGSGPEGEPLEPSVEDPLKPEIKHIGDEEYEVVSTVQKKDTQTTQSETEQSSPEREAYQGFGFDDWTSGLKTLTELGSSLLAQRKGLAASTEENDLTLYDYLPRSFASRVSAGTGLPTARLQELIESAVAGLKAAMTVEYH